MDPGKIVSRDALRGFAGCAAGIVVSELGGEPAEAAGRSPFPANPGLMTQQPKPLPYTKIPGFLSKAQLSPHHTAHHGGALKALLSHEQQLGKLLQGQDPLPQGGLHR